MKTLHAKAVRRHILTLLYRYYQEDPLQMPGPEDVLEDGVVSREELVGSIHYLADRGLVELMMGYSPPMFASARITADGIDLVESRHEFDLRFPAEIDELEGGVAEVPVLIERLVVEADLSALDGEHRRCLARDVQYLRDEVARPVGRWRWEVIDTVLGWIESYFADEDEGLGSLGPLKAALRAGRR